MGGCHSWLLCICTVIICAGHKLVHLLLQHALVGVGTAAAYRLAATRQVNRVTIVNRKPDQAYGTVFLGRRRENVVLYFGFHDVFVFALATELVIAIGALDILGLKLGHLVCLLCAFEFTSGCLLSYVSLLSRALRNSMQVAQKSLGRRLLSPEKGLVTSYKYQYFSFN